MQDKIKWFAGIKRATGQCLSLRSGEKKGRWKIILQLSFAADLKLKHWADLKRMP